ncbi:SAM and SH3 domain-containing protein 1-like isoform X1 [Bombus vosnesenskii]|uniref:Sterile alpha motif domain-containing protein 5 n=2 Tax=Pyrobombus TaxID=144703 RepID=A0A6J3KYP8_9HYME|nr:SAM and SH3 domain-containing protein 1-like isoform X1 [Bombus vancouverensis nearcticus]XP_033358250.1 SAM and SH3 domain-containing protein 1-like isoform X1 [Bombus vosnesenskii]XP_050474002.1 SAM and SH3 domain-containing protein 1-like isoform X1 [Bombus huntii]
MTMASNIVVEWLRSLHLGQYSESFIDNGYDDLEICKQIGDPDLDAIGVFNQTHRARLLQSVKTLREEGAASVYFTLEESNDCLCDNVSSKSSRTSSERPLSDKEAQRASPTASSSSGGQELTKFADEYEEGKAELVRIPRMQLRVLLQEKLRHDGIRLACQPYTTPEGERGYLEGLASRYADLFRTHYGDVLEPLEELRRRETNASPRMPNTQLTTSHSQPIYVPGKYSPSSCLSDKEEDEIYGFGYGVFSRQMLQQRQQKLALAAQNTTAVTPGGHQQPYQSCLSPRSALFYEFPPNEQGQTTSKKKTTFSRLLRGLKTHRKEKQAQAQGSPRHGRARIGVPQRVDTPDSVLQSGLGLGPDMGHTILRSMVDPRDYDRLRYLQMNGGQPNSFEETIHRLKVQEALRKKERFHKEHEEILRDIRQGLMQLGRDGRGQLPGDDTYMYDEDARCGGGLGLGPGGQHWYDEPPYESDPEDFLMGASGGPVPTATIQNGRVCFTLNLRPENRGEGIISLRTAGDISLPRDRSRKGATSTMRGLIVPQGHNNPPAIIPLTHSRASRESGDYASSDVQSRSSGEEGLSPSQSSDYEDQEELENQHSAAVHTSEASALLEGDTRAGIAGRARNLRHDVQRKISRLRQDRTSSEAFPCSASSVESLPSGSGSSTQALVRAGSNHSSISCEDRDAISPTSIGPVLCRARALVDYTPSPYDKEALKFKKGDIIDVVQMNKSGLWKGVLHNRIGHFKFINVEILNDRVPRRGEPEGRGKWGQRYRQKPGSVQELLQRMNLQEHIPVFVFNGYEDLELFREIEAADLDYLRIHQPEHRAKILTAVQLLNDLQSGSEGDLASSSEGDEVSRLVLTSGQTSGHCSPFNRRQFPRDSGCYDAHKNSTSRRTVSPESTTTTKLPRENNLDATASTKNVSGVSTEGSTVSDSKDDFHPNIPITSNVTSQKEGQFDKSPLLRSGNVRFIAKRGNFGETVVIEDTCESGQKLGGMVKYVVGSGDLGLEGTGNITGLGQRGCLSEKSSDSGVSSSSISSAPPPRDKVLANVASDSPTKNFSNFTRASPTSQPATNKSQSGETSYQ